MSTRTRIVVVIAALAVGLGLVAACTRGGGEPESVEASVSPLDLASADDPVDRPATTTTTSPTSTTTTTTAPATTTTSTTTTTAPATTTTAPPPAVTHEQLVAELDLLCTDRVADLFSRSVDGHDAYVALLDEVVGSLRLFVADAGFLQVPPEDAAAVAQIVDRVTAIADGYEQVAALERAGDAPAAQLAVQVVEAHRAAAADALAGLGVTACAL